jgi:nucleoside-diphosphate-sugar epimerase/predicted dehydrogenase
LKLLVTGAGGFLGREFVTAAAADGNDVVALVRRPSDGLERDAVAVIRRDVLSLDPDDLSDDLDAVVHFATGTNGDRDAIVHVAVEGTRRVFALAREASVPRFVHVSSMSVHQGPVEKDARAPGGYALEPRPESRGAYALSKVRAEQVLLDERDRGETELVICRPGLVYGRGMLDPLAGTAARLPLGLAVGLGRAAQHVPWIDVDDLNAALLGIVASPARAGEVSVYELLSSPIPTKRELIGAVQTCSGRPRRTIWLPTLVPMAAAAGRDALRRDLSLRTAYAVRRAWNFDPAVIDAGPAWQRAGRKPGATLQESVRRSLTIDEAFDRPLDDEVRRRARALLDVATRPDANRPARVVLVGAGRIADEMHVPALRSMTNVTVVGVVDPVEAAASAVANKLAAATFSRIEDLPDELLAGSTVTIATPGESHVDVAGEVVARGASVLVEKPAALSLAGFERLSALETSTTPVTAIHNYRLRPAAVQLWRFLVEHDVGPLMRARLRFASPPLKLERARWMRDEIRNRVLLYEIAVHFIDLLVQVSGELISLEHAFARRSSDGLQTISFSAAGSARACDDVSIDLDLTGVAPGVYLFLEFARSACQLDFFPDGFRILSDRPNPLDLAASSMTRASGALRQRLRRDRATRRARPHRLIYEEHLRRCVGADASPFGLGGIAETMRSLDLLDRVLYSDAVVAP